MEHRELNCQFSTPIYYCLYLGASQLNYSPLLHQIKQKFVTAIHTKKVLLSEELSSKSKIKLML